MPELDKKPELFEDLVPVWSAFLKLSRRRHDRFNGPGAIPYSEIEAYMDLHGVRRKDERVEFCELIDSMDAEFLGWAAKRKAAS